jgi:hypothetical protein
MSGLSYQQGPPLGLPMRFFVSAPLFLMLAGAVALISGPAEWPSRWSPAVLGIVHLLTLGYLGMVMAGALLQMVPVVLGASIPAVRSVALLAFSGLFAGAPLLALGLGLGKPVLLLMAMVVLVSGLLPFVVALAVSLARSSVAASVIWPFRQAWLALLLTLALGVSLAGGLSGLIPVSGFQTLTALHLAWGLGGWILILVVGVAYQVVPMLQLTPAYPMLASRILGWLILAGLAGYSVSIIWPEGFGIGLIVSRLALSAGAGAFAILTLVLQGRRRRKLADATLSFWRLGMVSLLGCIAAGWLLEGERGELVCGILFLLGFSASVVNGMLYKIVPFLAWFHLQSQTRASAGHIPNMKEFIPDAVAGRHFRMHALALACLAPSPYLPWPVASIGWLLIVLSGDRLWRNLVSARALFLARGGRL